LVMASWLQYATYGPNGIGEPGNRREINQFLVLATC
jgi:hypothetical protein